MSSLESLLLHLEHLDAQLPTREIYLHEGHLKVLKEVLLTKQEIKRRLGKTLQSGADAAISQKLKSIADDCGYNIDRVFELYRDAVVCPQCGSADVAVIKHGPRLVQELDYARHRNRRMRLATENRSPAAGTFTCNACFSGFVPQLPPNLVKLCELLFTYYY